MKKYYWFTGIIAVFLFICIPIVINFIMEFNFNVSGGEEEWIPFFASFYGALLGGIISGVLTLGGVYLTIKNERDIRISDKYPIKRKYAGDVLSEIEGLKEIIMEIYTEGQEEDQGLNLNEQTTNELNLFLNKKNNILNAASMVSGKFFYKTRKLISQVEQIIAIEKQEPFHPYHYLEMLISQVEYAKEVLENITFLKDEANQIDEAIDKMQ